MPTLAIDIDFHMWGIIKWMLEKIFSMGAKSVQQAGHYQVSKLLTLHCISGYKIPYRKKIICHLLRKAL